MFGDEEFFEGTTYQSLPDDGEAGHLDGNDAPAWQHNNHGDGVVCLVDCSESMFTPLLGEPAHNTREPQWDLSAPGAASTYFSMAMKSVHRLLMEKLKYTTSDVVAVVLYNTRQSSNAANSPGVYVALSPTRVGMECVRTVEQLEAAGALDAAAYGTFLRTIGHCERKRRGEQSEHVHADTAIHPDDGAVVAVAFSAALRVAQDILLGGSDAQLVCHRRLFVFTNDADPTHGSKAAWSRCSSHAADLGRIGVTLEVFGFGTSLGSAVNSVTITTSTATAGPVHAAWTPERSTSPSGTYFTASPAGNAAHFDPAFFWTRLQHCIQEQQRQYQLSHTGNEADTTATTAAPHPWARGGAGVDVGGVHVHAGPDTLHLLLSTVAHRVHPQRPYRRCELRIGGLSPHDDDDATGTAVPRMAVSLYAPLVPPRPPPKEMVEASTNLMVRRVVRLRAWGSGASGEEVAVEDLRAYKELGEERVYLTREEQNTIGEVAAAGAQPGFTILLFKELSAAVVRARSVERAAFLHPSAAEGGPQSLRLFVLLVRRLRAKGKVAIAHYRRSSSTAPRLVALVPSPDLTAHPERRVQLPVEGLGLYVVPLPYADDLRPIPDLETCTVVDRDRTPCLESTAVDPQHRTLAVRVIDALSASYDMDAVANPALQRHYEVLQRLVERMAGGTAVDARDGTNREGDAPPTAPAPTEVTSTLVDSSLPDYEGMKLHQSVFRDFQHAVLGRDYTASAYCPEPATERRRPRVGDSRDGGATTGASIQATVRAAAQIDALDSLTVAQLRDYLRVANVGSGGMQLKAQLVALVGAHVKATVS